MPEISKMPESFDYFDTKICLNQKSRPDRWKQFQDECKRVGLTDVQHFPSIDHPIPISSFCLSQRALLESFLSTSGSVLLALEDDVLFRNLSHLNDAINELPDNWDILYLGANVTEERPKRYSNHLFHVKSAWTTHAIAYRRNIAQCIYEAYQYDGADHNKYGMYDDFLSREFLPVCNAFVVAPMVAIQRPVYSDLWGNNVSYGWEQIDKKLQ